MASIKFQVKAVKSPDGAVTATLAEIDGSIDSATIQEFQQVMDKLLERGIKDLILDCANVKYINSTGLGTLLKYADTFDTMGGHIAFCRVPNKVMLVMEMLGFDKLFNIVADEASAMRAFSGQQAVPAMVNVRASTSTASAAAVKVATTRLDRTVAFPLQASCSRCRVTLDFPTAGKYKCPRCSALASVDAGGKVRFFASKHPVPVTISFPATDKYAVTAGTLASQCAEEAGFKSDQAHAVGDAVTTACKNLILRAASRDPQKTIRLQTEAVAHNAGVALQVCITDTAEALDFGPQGVQKDPGMAPVCKVMDMVEHRTGPQGGNVLTLTKNLNKQDIPS